ncbi:MAG TPA: alpha-1,2-fucosyltransferase [Deltaproteobacteria bacterium]|nr:alpha-1,2-fucosyltransferase [Deltaproteobacteria bacterium]
MIVVRLIGGLGNQLFQYAVARHIAEINGAVLKLDISGFETYKLHKYSLWPFNIKENFASLKEITTLMTLKQGIVGSIIRRILRKPPKLASTYIREKKPFQFDPDILNLSDGVYLAGSWQSEKYFADIGAIIRQEFTVKTPQAGKDRELAEQIASCESVSLHIRRGDYVSNPHTSEVHGTCGIDYYLRCVDCLTQTVKNPHFFIFSDEPEWAHNSLKLLYRTTIVGHNKADKNYEDLRLMSQCKHHIIANSTFSWWGAWLSQNPDKIVLVPKRWFKSDDYDPKDLIPDKWIKV